MQDNFDEYERTSVPRQAASTGKRRSAHGSTWFIRWLASERMKASQTLTT
ncbi:MAG TPA: hypothetical protein VHH94_01005 [Gammaproteobacteria bacterium]|nr:hypothetical protein [Gammaproteobacteria bacterium]